MKVSRFVTFVLVLLLALALCAPAFAQEVTPSSEPVVTLPSDEAVAVPEATVTAPEVISVETAPAPDIELVDLLINLATDISNSAAAQNRTAYIVFGAFAIIVVIAFAVTLSPVRREKLINATDRYIDYRQAQAAKTPSADDDARWAKIDREFELLKSQIATGLSVKDLVIGARRNYDYEDMGKRSAGMRDPDFDRAAAPDPAKHGSE